MHTRDRPVVPKILRYPRFLVGAAFPVVLVIVGLIALASPSLGEAAMEMRPLDRLAPPSETYLLGTDQFGRDILIRSVHVTGHYLLAALTATLAGLGLGALVGLWRRRGGTRPTGPLVRFLALGPLLAVPISLLIPDAFRELVWTAMEGSVGVLSEAWLELTSTGWPVLYVALTLAIPLVAFGYRLVRERATSRRVAGTGGLLAFLAALAAAPLVEGAGRLLPLGFFPPREGWKAPLVGNLPEFVEFAPWYVAQSLVLLGLSAASLLLLTVTIHRFWAHLTPMAVPGGRSLAQTQPDRPFMQWSRWLFAGAVFPAAVLVVGLLAVPFNEYVDTRSIPSGGGLGDMRTPREGVPLGTDIYGRDVLAVFLAGARAYAGIALAVVLLGMAAGRLASRLPRLGSGWVAQTLSLGPLAFVLLESLAPWSMLQGLFGLSLTEVQKAGLIVAVLALAVAGMFARFWRQGSRQPRSALLLWMVVALLAAVCGAVLLEVSLTAAWPGNWERVAGQWGGLYRYAMLDAGFMGIEAGSLALWWFLLAGNVPITLAFLSLLTLTYDIWRRWRSV